MDLPVGPDLLVRAERILLPSEDRFVRGEMVVRNGKITDIVRKGTVPLAERRGLEVLDVSDGTLCPAFYDSHMHLYQWSLSRAAVDLSGTGSWEEVLSRLESVSSGRMENKLFDETGYLVGVDYDDSAFKDRGAPSHQVLDRTFGNIPVMVRRVCGHVLHLNSASAESLGVPLEKLRKGPLKDDEAMAVSWKMPFDRRGVKRALKEGISAMWSLGVAGGVEIIPEIALERMMDHLRDVGGGLRLSICVSERRDRSMKGASHGIIDWSCFQGSERGRCTINRPEIVFEKHFMDGSIGAGTACFSRELTADFPESPMLLSKEVLTEKAFNGLEDGLIPMVHAIGDEAISGALGALMELGAPFRIEHSEGLTPRHICSLAGSQGVVSLQPNFQRVWGRSGGLYDSRLGDAYLRLNPFRSVNKGRIRWCFGSDMMPPGPLFGVKGAQEHPDPLERLDEITSLRGYSELSARYSILGSSGLGTFKVGVEADLAVIGPNMMDIRAFYLSGERKLPGP